MEDRGPPSTEEVISVTEPEGERVVTKAPGPPGNGEGTAPTGRWGRLLAWAEGLGPAWRAVAAFLMYQALAFVIWVVPILPRFASQHLGTGLGDSRYYQWALAWTPWALTHGMNPLQADLVFSPSGVDLAWSSFVPGPALVTWPVTELFGPLASLNLLLATAPALAAWAAFLVCNRLTHSFWPSVVGGVFFGFSAYMSGNMVGFANLVIIFPIALIAYIAIRRVEGSLGQVAFVAGFAILLVALFSISTEVFGTTVIFGGVAFVGALAFGAGIRRPLLRTGVLMLIGGVLAAIVLSPYILGVLEESPDGPLRDPVRMAAADLWSFAVPAPNMRFGGEASRPVLETIMKHPHGYVYVGAAGLALIAGFAITERRRRTTWLLVAFVAFVWLFALGPLLRIGGESHGSAPGRLLSETPLIQSAVPSRFAAYAALAIGVIAALWLSRGTGRSAWFRWMIALLAVVSLLPVSPHHANPQEIPAFLSSTRIREVLHEREIVYVIPDLKGDEMLWQATADFWFALAQGYIGPIPEELRTGPLARGLRQRPRKLPIPPPPVIATWMREHEVTAVIVDDRARKKFEETLRLTGLRLVYSGEGVSVWRPANGIWRIDSPAQ